jgi:hypothetical protein
VNPAASARRRIISFTACPVIAAVPMAPVRCTVGNTTRPGSTGAGSRVCEWSNYLAGFGRAKWHGIRTYIHAEISQWGIVAGQGLDTPQAVK